MANRHFEQEAFSKYCEFIPVEKLKNPNSLSTNYQMSGTLINKMILQAEYSSLYFPFNFKIPMEAFV